MKEITITSREEGQRLDKFLSKVLRDAGKSFIYKMLRKKNITLNGKKADGSEKLCAGDSVKLFFTDETFDKFAGTAREEKVTWPYRKLDVIYEDEHVMFINKPTGMLSQKASDSDVSLNEYLIGYLLREGQISEETLRSFRPAVCNRLDRNTSGLVTAGKTIAGLQALSRVLALRTVHKYYVCIVKGCLDKEQLLDGWLVKDERSNRVKILHHETENAQRIITRYKPLHTGRQMTMLEVELITGRSHQIRAHLASIGHPIIGDPKYGDLSLNDRMKKTFGVKGQLLHARRMELPQMEDPLSNISGRVIEAPLPPVYNTVLQECIK